MAHLDRSETGHHQCLLCGDDNPWSLKLQFSAGGNGMVLAQFKAHGMLQGYLGMVHGGIVAALLDAAMTNCLASRMNVPLDSADFIVISHGHYDHTGGLAAVLSLTTRARVYCHPSASRTRYSVRSGQARMVGMPEVSRIALGSLPKDRRRLVSQPMTIAEGIGLTGAIPRKSDFEDVGGPFFLDADAATPDTLEDDLAMWIATPKGLVIITGCAHAGLVNTLEHIRHIAKQDKIYAIIGGFHLAGASDRRLKLTAEALKALSPALVAPCHCTGQRAVESLRDVLGERVTPCSSGAAWSF
ncbi:MBL fold metallo-hydrolase [candidate division TA06 bacterium]|uniref:MBL fold metallo-hydrolase n=1 Tax=candidate division TA06 bacterium TaxID=2250710 RepID=A0A933MH64_UNCT6|nr:MBL fold metallo-hydrolase [candidate division TA06 bacterium]